jgi:hypothetical protein
MKRMCVMTIVGRIYQPVECAIEIKNGFIVYRSRFRQLAT